MLPFTPIEQREFIDSHIAHRLTALLSVFHRQKDPEFFSGKGDIYCASIEGSYIMLRVFIEFLGVESSNKSGLLELKQRTRIRSQNQKKTRETDVMLDCFGLELVSPDDFGSNASLVARVHDGLSKSTAHFTYRTDTCFDAGKDFHPSLEIVLQLLQQRFFDQLNETARFHPDLPPLHTS